MPDAIVCFYQGTTLVSFLVRVICRKPGQPLSAVPSHCGIVLPGAPAPYGATSILYEYVSTGWNKRWPKPDDYAWSFQVVLPDLPAAIAYAEHDQGRYRFWVDGAIGLARFIPNAWYTRFPKLTHLTYRHICSLFVKDVLRVGGWVIPAELLADDVPAAPNDILLALQSKS